MNFKDRNRGLARVRKGLRDARDTLRDARDTYHRFSGADDEEAAATPATSDAPVRRDEPDVVLDIPNLHVDEINLRIDELDARVALEAKVLDLLRLDVGVDAQLRGVGLEIKGVDAEAHLRVRLDNLTVIVNRVMTTIDRNPQILEGLTERLGKTIDEVGSGAGRAIGDIGEGVGSAVEDVGGIARALAPDGAQQHPGENGGP
jgi:hypothetical protein